MLEGCRDQVNPSQSVNAHVGATGGGGDAEGLPLLDRGAELLRGLGLGTSSAPYWTPRGRQQALEQPEGADDGC